MKRIKVWKCRIKNKEDREYSIKIMQEAKILYNTCNYFARLRYFNYLNTISREGIPYPNLDWTYAESLNMKKWCLDSKYNGNYNNYGQALIKLATNINKLELLPAKVKQNIVRDLSSNWSNFFKKKKGVHWMDCKPPHYIENECLTTPFNNQTFSKVSLKDNILKPTGFKEGVELPSFITSKNIVSAELKMSNTYVYLYVTYNDTSNVESNGNEHNIASIDLGINTLATLTFNQEVSPILVKNRKLKSSIQWNNKEISRLQALLAPHGVHTSKKIKHIQEKKNLHVYQELHRTANQIMQILQNYQVGQLVIGKNINWKQKVNLGRTNQMFTQIPFGQLINILTYKCTDKGIKLICQEESYTSKASFIDNDEIPVFGNCPVIPEFSGKRVKGQYETKHGQIVHADINASFNIMKKSNLASNIDSLKELLFRKPTTLYV